MAGFNLKDLLSQESKKVIKNKVVKNKEFEVEHIPINKIIPSKDNKYGIRDIEELAATIELFGLIHNITVRKIEGTDKYLCISGERRLKATTLLYEEGKEEYETIPCKIEKIENDILARLELSIANSTARVLTDWETTQQTEEIKWCINELKKQGYKFKGRIRDMVAEILKVSPAQVGIMDNINKKLSPGLKGSFEAEQINITTAYELSKLPQEQQEEAYKELEEKGSLKAKDVEKYKEEEKAPISLEDKKIEYQDSKETKNVTNITKSVINKTEKVENQRKTVIDEAILKLKEHIKVGTELGTTIDEHIVSLVILENMIPNDENFIKEVEERVLMCKNQLSLFSKEQEA